MKSTNGEESLVFRCGFAKWEKPEMLHLLKSLPVSVLPRAMLTGLGTAFMEYNKKNMERILT